jgi:hypothetical protein
MYQSLKGACEFGRWQDSTAIAYMPVLSTNPQMYDRNKNLVLDSKLLPDTKTD